MKSVIPYNNVLQVQLVLGNRAVREMGQTDATQELSHIYNKKFDAELNLAEVEGANIAILVYSLAKLGIWAEEEVGHLSAGPNLSGGFSCWARWGLSKCFCLTCGIHRWAPRRSTVTISWCLGEIGVDREG